MTDKPKFTPPPWAALGEYPVYYQNGTDFKRTIIGAGFRVGYLEASGDKPKEMREADAHLIAAAPDLYEAVAALFEYAEKHPNAVVCDMIAYGKVGFKLLAAKRKADGQS